MHWTKCIEQVLMMIYFVPDTVQDAVDTEMNKTDKVPVTKKILYGRREMDKIILSINILKTYQVMVMRVNNYCSEVRTWQSLPNYWTSTMCHVSNRFWVPVERRDFKD